MSGHAALIFFCGKMAAGKSTLARRLAEVHQAVLLVQDDFLERLFPGDVKDIPSYVLYSSRIGDVVKPLVCDLLARGVSVILDFPANTRAQRAWFRQILDATGASHELHFIDASDATCKRQLKQRSNDLPPDSPWVSEAAFDAVTAYFQPPADDESFNVIHHDRTS
jgi:predicted kinase